MNKRVRIPILWKVTLWYSTFLVMISIVVVATIYMVSGRIMRNTSKTLLMNVVEASIDELEYEDGRLEIDDDFDIYDDMISIVVYDMAGNPLIGSLPKRFPYQIPMQDRELRRIEETPTTWYVYDCVAEVEDYGMVQVRGVTPATSTVTDVHTVLYVLAGVLPILILVATVGGFMITKRAFRPVAQMRTTVEQINDGKDLTRRVNLGDGKDELYKLGHTFDRMFERLEESFEREKQFTSDVSHELRTPISVMLSQCEYALEQENPKETEQCLNIIYKQTTKMHRLIQQLLQLSRCDQGFERLQLESFSMSELLEVVLEEMEEKASAKHIRIESDIESDVMIRGDETLLMRMMVNLLNNAIHYGCENGWIRVCLSRKEHTIYGMVADNGIGIDRKEQDKIWNRFYQVNPARTSNDDDSMGLGLSMVKWIVEAHGGTIRVESELGKGSKFIFELKDGEM